MFALSIGIAGCCAAAFAGSAAALPAGCVQAAATVSCSYAFTGTEQQFVVPAGVYSVGIVAVGGEGGGGSAFGGPAGGGGGSGAAVGGSVPAVPGEVLYVEVGGNGGTAPNTVTAGAAGFNGGGAGQQTSGVAASGGGGGASDVRTCAASACALGGATDPRLLVAGGGGGGGAGLSGAGGDGGAAELVAAAGDNGVTSTGGGGGGGGGATLVAGGTGGTAGTTAVQANGGTTGVAGQGGTGNASDGYTQAVGGGGGGGFFGGGGGGSGGWSSGQVGGGGGGGAGSSMGPAGSWITQDATGVPSVTISYAAPSQLAQLSTGSLSFGTQAQNTLSAPQTVLVKNAGGAPLMVFGVTFAGSDPGDFVLSSNGCMGLVPSGATCVLGVSFAPQAQGARTATMQIASSDPSGTRSVALSGTGGQLPAGAAGANGPAGKVELITCKTVTKKVKGRLRKVQKCTGKLVSGTVKFTVTGKVERATLSRGHTVYAAGTSVSMGRGQTQFVLSDLRTMRAGRYVLTTRDGRGRLVTRRTIVVS